MVEILSSNKLAISDEGDLVRLVADFIKYRQDRTHSLPKIAEDDPENDPKFWQSLHKEEREAREKAREKRTEEEAKAKEEEEKKENDLIAGMNDKCEAFSARFQVKVRKEMHKPALARTAL